VALQVLSYHIIPRAIVFADQLQDKARAPTALAGAALLTVSLKCNKVDFVGARNDARVQQADIKVGKDIVLHVVDDVLLPEL
jgi:uncharacterized surface protein with fasciclin (FAS1) repeats